MPGRDRARSVPPSTGTGAAPCTNRGRRLGRHLGETERGVFRGRARWARAASPRDVRQRMAYNAQDAEDVATFGGERDDADEAPEGILPVGPERDQIVTVGQR